MFEREKQGPLLKGPAEYCLADYLQDMLHNDFHFGLCVFSIFALDKTRNEFIWTSPDTELSPQLLIRLPLEMAAFVL